MVPSPLPLLLALVGVLVVIIAIAVLAVRRARQAPPLPPPVDEALCDLLDETLVKELRDLLPRYAGSSVWVRRAQGEVEQLEVGGYCRAVLRREIRSGTELSIGEQPGPPWMPAGADPLFGLVRKLRAFEERLEAQFADVEALKRALDGYVSPRGFAGRLATTFTLLIVILVLCMMLVAYYTGEALLAVRH